jgi:ribonuclease P protein component
VARNRARRLLREAWRVLSSRVTDGHELVLVARGPFDDPKASELIEEIEDLLTQAGVMRE